MPENRGDIVKVLLGTAPNTRVAIVKRPDGNFEIRPEQWLTRVHDADLGILPQWVPIKSVSGIFAPIELAEAEALVEYPWISRVSD